MVMTTHNASNAIPAPFTASDDEANTRIEIIEGEMYETDNRIMYIENQLEEIRELITDLYKAISGVDNAGNITQTVEPTDDIVYESRVSY
jgi:hypothetical protein